MELKTERKDGVMTVSLCGEIDHHTAAAWRTAIDRETVSGAPRVLVLDFSEVTFMDSSGIGLVMGRYRLTRSLGAVLRVTGLSPRLQQMMRLGGLEKLPVWSEKEEECE